MPAIITRGVPELYYLDILDEDNETFVSIKPATVAENAQRDEIWAKQSRTYNVGNPDAVEVKTESTFSQRRALETFLTLVDCNILWQDKNDDDTPKGDAVPMFVFAKRQNGESYLAMDRSTFVDAWGRLPEEAAQEIYQKVLIKNPQWDIFR